jgi:hypothetical protein
LFHSTRISNNTWNGTNNNNNKNNNQLIGSVALQHKTLQAEDNSMWWENWQKKSTSLIYLTKCLGTGQGSCRKWGRGSDVILLCEFLDGKTTIWALTTK